MAAQAAALAADTAIDITDDAGNKLRLARPASRIVSLSPHVTEMVYAAGAGDRLVGVTRFSDYPPQARKLPLVGDNTALDYDRLLALKPDLVLVWIHGIGTRQGDKIRSLGIPVFYSEPENLEQIAGGVEKIGVMAGTQRAASSWAAGFRQRHTAMAERYSARPPVRVFYEFSNRPLSTLNRNHVVSRLIGLCGGINVFANAPSIAPSVTVEAVIAADPQAIVISSTGAARSDWAAEWKRWGEIEAVRRGNVFTVDSDLVVRPGPRALDGAQLICDALEAARTRLR
jgi:iron complex transport system substrate-binding protein